MSKKADGGAAPQRKKKRKAFDNSDEACGLFGVHAGSLVRTPLGRPATVIGVKYADPDKRLEPTLWVELPNGSRSPLDVMPGLPLTEQRVTPMSRFVHLARDVDGLGLDPGQLGGATTDIRDIGTADTPGSFLAVAEKPISAEYYEPPPSDSDEETRNVGGMATLESIREQVLGNTIPPPVPGTTESAAANADPVVRDVAVDRDSDAED
jgi:hypothetical protein